MQVARSCRGAGAGTWPADPAWRARILVLRIGGNDLLNLLGLRRQRGHTLYETPLGAVIARLVTTFKPHGFRLSAPVFE